ncbi:MAG: hypothetical protein PHN72_02505 [Bacilli bacterium]|nr:hypothetical protein [Bacilli bacterium]
MENEINIKNIYMQTRIDFDSFKEKEIVKNWGPIYTTSDFFTWRDFLKTSEKENSEKRNKLVEEAIANNPSLELLYSWTKFSRVITRTRAAAYVDIENMKNSNYYNNALLERKYFNPNTIATSYLSSHTKNNEKQLFEARKILSMNPKTFYSVYEFQKLIMTDEESSIPWNVEDLVILLNAYGITKKDLLTMAQRITRSYFLFINHVHQTCLLKKEPHTVIKKMVKVKQYSIS